MQLAIILISNTFFAKNKENLLKIMHPDCQHFVRKLNNKVYLQYKPAALFMRFRSFRLQAFLPQDQNKALG